MSDRSGLILQLDQGFSSHVTHFRSCLLKGGFTKEKYLVSLTLTEWENSREA